MNRDLKMNRDIFKYNKISKLNIINTTNRREIAIIYFLRKLKARPN